MGSEVINNFTPRALQVLALARKEADLLHHTVLGTEHLLLGLTRLGEGLAIYILHEHGLSLEKVRIEVEKRVGVGQGPNVIGHIKYSAELKRAIAFAVKEAKKLNHDYLSIEHLLLGLLRERNGAAAKILADFGME